MNNQMNFYFSNMNFLFTIINSDIKYFPEVGNILMHGSVSQNFDLDLDIDLDIAYWYLSAYKIV